MNNRETTASYLAKLINQALIIKFGRVPSASLFANQFNLRAYGTSTITRETARKWILGLSIPEIDKLIVLTEWLDLDISSIFKRKKKTFLVNQNLQNKPNGHDIDYHIQNCLRKLNNNSKNAVFIAALVLKELESSEHNHKIYDDLINKELIYCTNCKKRLTANNKISDLS